LQNSHRVKRGLGEKPLLPPISPNRVLSGGKKHIGTYLDEKNESKRVLGMEKRIGTRLDETKLVLRKSGLVAMNYKKY